VCKLTGHLSLTDISAQLSSSLLVIVREASLSFCLRSGLINVSQRLRKTASAAICGLSYENL